MAEELDDQIILKENQAMLQQLPKIRQSWLSRYTQAMSERAKLDYQIKRSEWGRYKTVTVNGSLAYHSLQLREIAATTPLAEEKNSKLSSCASLLLCCCSSQQPQPSPKTPLLDYPKKSSCCML